MRSTPAEHLIEALLFSCCATGVAVGLIGQSAMAALVVASVALLHAALLGVPAYFLFRRLGWVNVVSSVALGFVAACLPVGLLLFPGWSGQAGSSLWQGNVPLVINGMSTAEGWQSYWHTLFLFGRFGAAVGALFWTYLYVRSRQKT